MATRRTTSDKRQRERAKQAKAAAKRARRQGQGGDGFEEATPAPGAPTETTEELIARMESLQEKFDAGQIEFEEFDEQKSELLDKIALSLTA